MLFRSDSARRAASSERAAACSARVASAFSSFMHPAPRTVTNIKLAIPALIDRKRIPLTSLGWPPEAGWLEKSPPLGTKGQGPQPTLCVITRALPDINRRFLHAFVNGQDHANRASMLNEQGLESTDRGSDIIRKIGYLTRVTKCIGRQQWMGEPGCRHPKSGVDGDGRLPLQCFGVVSGSEAR